METTDITATDLQDEILGPIIIEECRQRVSKRMKNDDYMKILAGFTRSITEDFESYLRTEVDLVEDDIRIVVDEYNSSFIT